MTTISGNNTGSVQLTTVQTQTSSTETTTTKTDIWVIGETAYTFIRPKAVTFKAEGLKPNTQYYPFFDNTFVGNFCSTQDNLQSSTIFTDSLGAVIGNFYIPGNTFVCGSHLFKLVDNVRQVGDSLVADPIYGSAQSTYEANGVLKSQQTQITQDSVVDPTPVIPPVLPPIDSNTGNPIVNPPEVTVCETWYFEYEVKSSKQQTFTVDSQNSTPPTDPQPSVGATPILPGTIAYISTVPIGFSKFRHTFSFRSNSSRAQIFRQEFVGPKVNDPATDLPDLTNFRPSGLLSTDIISITKQWTRIGNTACPVVFGFKMPKRVDPLAQSFFVDAADYPNGMFITSIGLYFRTVDQSTPAILELREMVNGLPGSNILPGGAVVLPGYVTEQSFDASIPTVFRFDHPIFLQPSTDYCFVLKSTSMGYNAWCSRVGEIDTITNEVISEQPFSGTLFKSENDVTWIPDSYEDLKFDLNVATFNTGSTANLIFRPQRNSLSNTYYNTAQALPLSFIRTVKDSKAVDIKIPMHSLKTGDKILIEGIVTPTPENAFNNILAPDLQGEFTVTVLDEDNVRITTVGNFASRTGSIRTRDIFSTINNIPAVMPLEIQLVESEPFINEGTESPSTIQTARYEFIQPIPPGIVSDTSFKVYTNIPVNEVMIDYLGTEFDQTEIIEKISLATGQSTAGAETPYAFKEYVEIQKDGSFYSFDEPRMLATPLNETLHSTELGSNPSAVVNIQLKSNNKDISPIIDINGLSIMTRSYKIDNQNDEITDLLESISATETDFNDPLQNSEVLAGKGKASAKYKSVINILKQPTNRITLFVSGNCPAPAAIDAYIRTSTDVETHVDREWEWVPINGEFGSPFINSRNKSVINEWMYIFDSVDNFTVFDVKLVMRSTNNSIIPIIYGIRTITDFI